MQPQKNLAEEMTQLATTITMAFYEASLRPHLIRSGRSHVFRLDFSDGRESKLLKIARAGSEGDVFREQQILPALRKRGFEVPCIEYTQEETDFDVPFTIMGFVEGGGMENVGTMPPAMARADYEHLGHFLARLSVLDAQTVPGAQTSTRIYEYIEYNRIEAREFLLLHPRCTPRLLDLLERGCKLQQEKTGFVNWDGPQVITDGQKTFTIIDWGLAGAGHPLFDLSMFLSWHGFSIPHLKNLPIYPEWRTWVLQGYLGGRPLTVTMREQIHLLGMSFGVRQAMAMARHHEPGAEDYLLAIEAEDVAFQSVS